MKNMSVRELKEKLENVPDETIVYYQRIEDKYFETGGWETTEIDTSDYVKAFTAKYHEVSNAFVVNAHY